MTSTITSSQASVYETWYELRFTTDDLNNTSLVDEEDTVVFSASSQGKGTRSDMTYVGASGAPIAHLESRRLRSDKLTFVKDGKETSTSVSEWLAQSKGWEPGQVGKRVFFVELYSIQSLILRL